jgi:Domain of unknown function (DUF5753)
MVEALHRVPTRDLAGHLDKAFGTPGTFARLEGRLRDLPFPASFRPFAAYETEATALYVFEVPGLLQTPEYARAVMATRPNTAEDEIGNLVAVRLARQAVLSRDDPPAPLLWALIALPRSCGIWGWWTTRDGYRNGRVLLVRRRKTVADDAGRGCGAGVLAGAQGAVPPVGEPAGGADQYRFARPARGR